MKKELIDLQRTFVHLPGKDWSNSSAEMAEVAGETITWTDILSKRCSVIVGTANSGKSSEFELQRTALRKAGEHCALVPVRVLIGTESVRHAFDAAEWTAIEAWKVAKTSPLILFLDSIDEAAIRSSDDLKIALRKLSDAIGHSRTDVRWVLSTRPAMLNNDVRAAIAGALDVTFPELHVDDSSEATSDSIDCAAKSTTDEVKSTSEETVQRYALRDLTHKQTERYIRERLKITDAYKQIEAAQGHGLSSMLRTPGRLNLLGQMNIVANPPVTLSEIYRRAVDLQLNDSAGIRKNISNATPESLHKAISRIACASTLCEKLNIDLPATADAPDSSALSARTIVRELTDAGLSYLLGTSLFEDSGYYHQVKLQPDDFRAYLAAVRLNELINCKQDAINVLQVIGWKAPTGESGVFSKWLPMAGWLATLNRHFRIEVLNVDPQAVAFFGDLRSVEPEDGKAALSKALERIAQGEYPGRHTYTLTSENYWQAGPSYLEGHLGELFDKFGSNKAARRVLLKIAIAAKSPCLKAKILAEVGDDYNALIRKTDSLAYFIEVAEDAERKKLAEFVRTPGETPAHALELLVESLAWNHLTAGDIAALTLHYAKKDSDNFSLRWRIKEALELASYEHKAKFAHHLLEALEEKIPEGSHIAVGRALREMDWLVEMVAETLASLIEDAPGPTESQGAISLVETLVFAVEPYGFSTLDVKNLKKALSNNPAARIDLLSRITSRAGNNVGELQEKLFFQSSLFSPTLKEAEHIGSEPLITLLRQYEAQRNEQRPSENKRANRKDRAEIEKTKERLKAEITAIEAGTAKDALAWIAQRLAFSNGHSSKYGDSTLEAFESEFGPELASATARGLAKLWRNEPPAKDENNPNSKYWITIAGLQGVNLELGGVSNPVMLSEDEAVRALDYALYEINGLPSWFWNVVERYSDTTIPFLKAVLEDHAKTALARERAVAVVSALRDASESMLHALGNSVWALACQMEPIGEYELHTALSVVVNSKSVTAEQFSKEAKDRIFQIDEKLSAIWAAHWISVAPGDLLGMLEAKDSSDKEAVEKLIFEVAANLEHDADTKLAELVKSNEQGIEALARMYLRLIDVIPPAADPVRPSGVVYSVGGREQARRFREKLPLLIASANSPRAYDALKALQACTKHEPELFWLRRLSSQVAETMRTPIAPMSEEDYLRFEQELHRPALDVETFAQSVENDILEVKDDIENGDFSPRRFLGSRRKSTESKATYERALEDDFQLYLAGQLALIGKKRYSVVREEQLAEATRRDIGIHHPSLGRATLELKASETGWTLAEYKKALHEQLVGLYMKARGATIGFLVILLQRERKWECEDGATVDFAGLLTILVNEANALEVKRPDLRLRVIGINASEPLGWDDASKSDSKSKAPGKSKTSGTPGGTAKKTRVIPKVPAKKTAKSDKGAPARVTAKGD